jgi:hypothetical protein
VYPGKLLIHRYVSFNWSVDLSYVVDMLAIPAGGKLLCMLFAFSMHMRLPRYLTHGVGRTPGDISRLVGTSMPGST